MSWRDILTVWVGLILIVIVVALTTTVLVAGVGML